MWDAVLTALRQRAARGAEVRLQTGRAPGLREAALMHLDATRRRLAPAGTAVLIDGRIRYAGLPALSDAFADIGCGERPQLGLCARWEDGEGYCYALPLGAGAVREAALGMILRAERRVRLLFPAPDAALTEALLQAERAGAAVEVYTGRGSPALQVGKAVHIDARVRTLACCVDGSMAILGNRAGGLWVCGDGAAGLEVFFTATFHT